MPTLSVANGWLRAPPRAKPKVQCIRGGNSIPCVCGSSVLSSRDLSANASGRADDRLNDDHSDPAFTMF